MSTTEDDAPLAYLDVSPDATVLASRVAHTFTALVGARLEHSSHDVHVCLTGGRVADQVHRVLAGVAEGLDWNRIHVWWGDERFVPLDSPDRNDHACISRLLDRVGQPEAVRHRFPGPDTGELARAATSFAAHVDAKAPDRFDLVMLGTGEDGHVASVFPGHDDPTHGDVVAVTDSPKPPAERLSLTLERLARAGEVWVIAAGEAKASAVASAGRGDDLPLAEVTRRARQAGALVHWFVDDAAAAQLDPQEPDVVVPHSTAT